jgi:hypothetical protein
MTGGIAHPNEKRAWIICRRPNLTPNRERYGAASEISRAKNNMMSEQSRRLSPKPKVPDMPVEMLRKFVQG